MKKRTAKTMTTATTTMKTMTKPVTNGNGRSQSLRAYVYGTLRYARRQSYRERSSHYGLSNAERRVQTEFLDEIAGPEIAEATAPTDAELTRRRTIVVNQIQEYTVKPAPLKLIERHLFGGETIAAVAESLGMNSASARSHIARVKDHLGLTK